MAEDPIIVALSRLEAGQTQLRVDVMARLDRVQSDITAIRDDIAVNFGTADDVRKANDHTREEVRSLHEVVALMRRQIQRLQTTVREIRGEP